jgi:putative nucleotidyltransferase with HDIG domain
MSKRIRAENLKIGMSVVQLDRPWTETDFPFQGLLINSYEDIAKVKKYCRFVYIDDGLSGSTGAPFLQKFDGKRKQAFSEQLADARQTYQKTKGLIQGIHHDIRAGRTIDAESARTLIQELVPKVARQLDALMWITNLHNRDEYTANHSINVCILSVVLGHYLGLEQNDLETLGLGALLHDIGKIKVPLRILNKPGRLTDDEFQIMKSHTVHGAAIVKATGKFSDTIASVALSHHEHFSSGGYPNNIKLNQSDNFFSQLVAVVDVYDALTSDRIYRKELPADKALQIMHEKKGQQFSPGLLDEFTRLFRRLPGGSLVELNTGEVDIKMYTGDETDAHPVVLIILDEHKRKCYPLKIVDFRFFANTPTPYAITTVLPPGSYTIDFGHYLDEIITAKS